MEAAFAALEALAPIEALRFSRWSYAALNTTHVFAIALLVGGSVPLSLRLLGFWQGIAHAHVVRLLSLTAGAGVALALVSGFFLFATRATEYATMPLFQAKLVLVGLGTGSALFTHLRHGWDLRTTPRSVLQRTGFVSVVAWTGALIAGRMIAFTAS